MLKLIYTCVCLTAYACLYQDTLELLQARVSALDSATLDQVEARLQVRFKTSRGSSTFHLLTFGADVGSGFDKPEADR